MTSNRSQSFQIQALQLTDALLVWLAFSLSWQLRYVVLALLDRGTEQYTLQDSVNWILYIAVPFTPLVLERFGFYDHFRTKSTSRAVTQLFQSILIIALFISLYAMFAKLLDMRRLVLGIGFIMVFFLLLLRDRLTARHFRRKELQDSAKERIIIAGSGDEMKSFYDQLDPDVTSGWKVVSYFDLGQQSVEALYDLLKKESVSRVIFSAKETGFDKVARAVEACELQGVEAWIAASFIRTQIARPVFDALQDQPMLVLRSTPDLSWELLLKNLLDRLGALTIILLSSPLWVFAAIGIRIQSPGAPVLFSQMRAGRYGKPFRMWKFRTMVANAEELLEKIKQEHGNQMDGPVFKLDQDPRIFPFGALLRKLSIDELPQLLNVAMGDMSLVGPRPLPLYEVEAFPAMHHRRRLSVKPGITCYWQIEGRNHITSFDDWVALDLKYIDNWSLWQDFVILVRTIPAVLFGKGAK